MIWMEKRVDAEIEGKTPVSVSREQFKHLAVAYIGLFPMFLGSTSRNEMQYQTSEIWGQSCIEFSTVFDSLERCSRFLKNKQTEKPHYMTDTEFEGK